MKVRYSIYHLRSQQPSWLLFCCCPWGPKLFNQLIGPSSARMARRGEVSSMIVMCLMRLSIWPTNAHVSFRNYAVLCFGQLVDEARKQERLLWYTSVHPDTPLHSSLPLNTAVALPISLSVLRRDLCFVFFAEHDVHVSSAKDIKISNID